MADSKPLRVLLLSLMVELGASGGLQCIRPLELSSMFNLNKLAPVDVASSLN